MAAVALVVDYGALTVAKRRLQGAVDLAALVAAQSPATPGLARTSLSDNGFVNLTDLRVESGRYLADARLATTNRFVPGGAPANAVRVTAETTAPLFFGRAIVGRDELPVTATGLASRAQYASFSIGSRLASLQGGLANRLLGAMLGTNLSLDVMDYRALADAKLDAFSFLDKMALDLDLQAATYSETLAGRVALGRAVAGLSDASRASGASSTATSALTQVATALRSAATSIGLDRLVDLGDVGAGLTRAPEMPRSAGPLGALDVLLRAAGVANGSRQVQLDLGATLPGIAQARLTIAIGERPQSPPVAAPVGTQVRTAQTRLLLESWITAPLGLGQIYLPLYVEIAQAEATLQSIACPWSSPDQLSVTVAARPGVVDAAIALVPPGAIQPGPTAPSLSTPAPLLQLPLISATGRSRVTIESPSSQLLVFSRLDIDASRARTATTTGMAGSLASSLVGNLSIDVTILGLGIGLPTSSTIRSALLTTIAGVTPALDGIIDQTLATLGIGIGQADIRVHGVRCDRAALVQ